MSHDKAAYFLIPAALIIISLSTLLLYQLTPLSVTQALLTTGPIFIWASHFLTKSSRHLLKDYNRQQKKDYQQCCKIIKQAQPLYKRFISALGFTPKPIYLVIGTEQSGKTQLLEAVS